MGNDWNWLQEKWDKAKMTDKLSDNAAYGKWDELQRHAKWSRRMARIALVIAILSLIINIWKG